MTSERTPDMEDVTTEQRSIDPGRFAAMQPTQPTAPPRRTGEVVGSVAALLLLVVGLPALLIGLAGVPSLPSDLPSAGEFADELGADDLVHLLVGIVWLTWLWFVVCVGVEIVAARRGGLARPVPLGGPVQHLARVLVGAILLTGIMAAPAQAAGGSAEAPPTVAASALVEAELPTVQAPPPPVVVDAGLPSYTVQPPKDGYHDNLWDIAERHLGDGRRYVEIFELNKDAVQADGRKLELARLIQPGWQLAMPADAVGLTAPAPAQAPAPPPPPAPTEQALQASADVEPGSVELGAEDGDRTGWLAGGGLLAAGILVALGAARRRATGRRPDGDALAIEADLRVGATPDRIDRLDRVLRDLTRAGRAAGVPAPPAYAVTVDDTAVELLLAPARAEVLPGWEALDDGRRWRRADVPDGDLQAEVTPYPALVGLGVDGEGRDVLIDLEAAGGLVSIEGDPTVAGHLATALAVHGATAPWADVVRVRTAGLPERLVEVGDGRLGTGDLAVEVAELERIAATAPGDVLTGRIGRRGQVPSHVLISGDAPSPDLATRLGVLVGEGRRTVSVVVVGEHRAARWRLHVDTHGTVTVPLLDLTVTGNLIGPAQVDAAAELFSAAADEDVPEAGDRVAIETPVHDVDDAAWAAASRRVGVLGVLSVQGGGALAEERQELATEMTVYLALHPGGVHPTVLAGALWPRGVTTDVRDAAIDRVRTWLGTTVDGSHVLREDAEGRLSLADGVVCDWDCARVLFLRSRRATTPREEVELLRRGLQLVRGEAFTRVAPGRYAWAAREDLVRTVTRVVVDASRRLAELLSDQDDPAGASHAAVAGLRVGPGDQRLWRSLIRSRYAELGPAGVHQTLAEMADGIGASPLEAETEALVDELVPSVDGGASGRSAG